MSFDEMTDEEFIAWENENVVAIPGHEKEFEEWKRDIDGWRPMTDEEFEQWEAENRRVSS